MSNDVARVDETKLVWGAGWGGQRRHLFLQGAREERWKYRDDGRRYANAQALCSAATTISLYSDDEDTTPCVDGATPAEFVMGLDACIKCIARWEGGRHRVEQR